MSNGNPFTVEENKSSSTFELSKLSPLDVPAATTLKG